MFDFTIVEKRNSGYVCQRDEIHVFHMFIFKILVASLWRMSSSWGQVKIG